MKHWCLNGIMVDTNKYSSPVPLIGLYTAAATLACLLLIISDMWAGFRHKKLWLPCRLFSLNSVTLTLISISSKLPVDLTSPMPSAQDQLSKLTGTVFICMSMGFLMPSLGILGNSESQANLLALSIFVVTVVVNICIQIATGVISSFIVEHSIILFCILMLTILLWLSSLITNSLKGRFVDLNKDLFREGIEESMLRRLQVCYLHGYYSSPQFVLCGIQMCGTISLICTVCVVVLAEVLLRSLAFEDLKFCNGVSAYGWSMWIIVGTQVLTVAVISIAMGCRWFNFAFLPKRFFLVKYYQDPYAQILIPFYMRNAPKCFHICFRFVHDFLVFPCLALAAKAIQLLTRTLAWLCHKTMGTWKVQDGESIEHFRHLLQTHGVRIKGQVLNKGVDDMERWMELNRRKPPQCLTDLLSLIRPSQESIAANDSLQVYVRSGVSCLSILLLVEIAKVSMPSDTALIMKEVVDEMFHIICFIDGKINAGIFESKVKSMTAKMIQMGRIHAKVVDRPMDNMVEPQAELDHALDIIRKFHRSVEAVVAHDEACTIGEIIGNRSYASLNELYDQIKFLFVSMLQALLGELPKAIFKHISESPAEEYEERVRLGLKFVCEMESVEPYLRWSFPIGSNINSLVIDQVSARHNSPVEDNSMYSSAPVIEDVGEIQVHRQDDIV